MTTIADLRCLRCVVPAAPGQRFCAYHLPFADAGAHREANGGAAFGPPNAGMTLRDYLAAHAPPVPSEFRPTAIGDTPTADCPADLADDITRVVLWRWYYADSMLATARLPVPTP